MTEVLADPPTETAADESPPAEGFVEVFEEPPTTEATQETTPPEDSPEYREYLERRPAVNAALQNVKAAKEELAAALTVLNDAKKAYNGKDAAMTAAWERLYEAENGPPPDAPTPLFDQAAKEAAAITPAPVLGQEEWDAKWNEFLAQSIDLLEVSDGIKEKLRDATPEPVSTLADLVKIKTAHPVKGYCAIKGIGEKKADEIDDAFESLQTMFLEDHPNPSPGASPQAPQAENPESPRGSYDFVDTFPILINPAGNEENPDSYHKAIIETAETEREELLKLKQLLASGNDESGNALTPKKRKKLETKLGETELQYQENFSLYGEKFGARAAEALQNFIESKVEKKSSLKGGID